MFSYRHAFHAGNHADVLKHTVLLAILQHLRLKEKAITVFDTHAGAGLYRLDGDYAATSGEAANGYLKLVTAMNKPAEPVHQALKATKLVASPGTATAASALQEYLDLVASFNQPGSHKVYPGSPFIIQRLLGGRDKLKLFEIHPTDAKTLAANIAQLAAGRQVAVLREDGFEALKKFLPPPARRALVLCDPSYEIKSDYHRVVALVADSLTRFATGCYAVWYPLIPRPEAHDLPRKLKTLANKSGKPWLNVTLSVKWSKLASNEAGEVVRPGLPASGMFIINPPHTLAARLKPALAQMANLLGQDSHAASTMESGG
jgi:23S rRNA (adenine2030-N6)-methyltransferase